MQSKLITDCAALFVGEAAHVGEILAPNSVDAIVTDPPAGIAFMGREWDGDKGIPIAFDGPPPPQALTSYVDVMHRRGAEAGGVDDVRFAGSDSPLGFGKWRGAVAMAVRAELPQPGSTWRSGSRTPS